MTDTSSGDRSLVHRYADLGDVRLHYVEQGEGPLVLLLHGFPEFWYSWRHQIPALAAAGFRVIAPDLRGYNLSSKPRGVSAYYATRLASDVERLIRALGVERATVVGHDWGGWVAWAFAMLYPDSLERLAILNVPHPDRFMRGLRRLSQLKKSSYWLLFQVPWLPERLLAARRYAVIRRTFRSDPVRPGAFTEDDIDRYVAAAAQPGALSAGINYYRALFRQGPWRIRAQLRVVRAPVLVVWGERDRYLGAELAEPDRAWVPNVRVERIPDASHWVQVDQPDRVNALLLEFLAGLRPQRSTS